MKLLENNWGKIRCPYCDSVMEIEKDDIQEHYDDGLYVVCPICDSIIWCEDNPVVKNIKQGILWHK